LFACFFENEPEGHISYHANVKGDDEKRNKKHRHHCCRVTASHAMVQTLFHKMKI